MRQIIGDPAIRLVSLMEATLYTSVGTLQAYLPLYALTRHISIAQIGLIFGGQGIASIVSRPFMGSAADRLGRRPFIMIGVALCAAVLVAIPFIGSFWTLLGLAVLFGLGTGMVTPSTTAMIGDLVKRGVLRRGNGSFRQFVGCRPCQLARWSPAVLIVWLGYQAAFGIIAATILAALAVFVLGSRDPKFGSK